MPSLIACILEAINLRRGQSILQIGTGPGYLVSLLAHLLSGSGVVVTIEIDPDIAAVAMQKLLSLGYSNIKCVLADGFYGDMALAPFDRIIATASCTDVPLPWIEQLADSGLIILPLSFTQRASCYPMIVFHKENDFLKGTIIESLPRVGFLPLYGNSVVTPVQYDQRITKVETEIALFSRDIRYNTEDSKAIFLISMLFLAQAIDADPDLISLPSSRNVLEQAVRFWEQHYRPNLRQFSFVLAPKGRDLGSYAWSFPKNDHNLLVAL